MKKVLSFLFALVLSLAFTACEDVPAPYSVNDNPGGGNPSQGVEPAGDGTLESPYNVAAANQYIRGGGDETATVYVRGTICSIDEIDTGSYGNAIYSISDTGTALNALKVYRGYSLGGKKFTSDTEIKVGDVVVVSGKLVNYNGTYEFTSGSSIVSINDESGSVESPIEGENLLDNGDFEGEWSGNKPDGWNGVTGNAALSQSNDAHTGAAAVIVAGSSSSNLRLASKSYTLKPGTYTYSAYVKQPGATAGQYRLGYAKLTNGVVADTQNDYIYLTSAASVSSAWQQAWVNFTLEVTTEVNFIVMNSKNGGGADILVDDIALTTADGGIVEGGDEPAPDPGTATPKGDGTLASPFNPAAAHEYIAKGGDESATVYVEGVISYIQEVSTSYGNATYYISEDGRRTSDELEVFRGYALGNQKFTSESQIKVGDKVVVCGKLVNYNGTTHEFTTGNYIVSLNGQSGEQGGNGGDSSDPTPSDGIGTVSGNTISFKATDLGLENATDVTNVTLSDGTVVTFAQGDGNNAPKYYTSGSAVRMYALNTLTVKAQKAIASVVVKHVADYGGNETLTASKGTLSRDAAANTLTVSGVNANEVQLFNAHTGNSGGTQLRVVSIEITYAGSAAAARKHVVRR